jgi:hypothetical protein
VAPSPAGVLHFVLLLANTVWLADLARRLKPIYPDSTTHWVCVGVLMAAFFSWVLLLIRTATLLRLLFDYLHAFRREVEKPGSRLPEAFARLHRPANVALGRTLYYRRPPSPNLDDVVLHREVSVHLGSSWVDGMRRHPGIPITGPAQPLRRRPRIGPSPLAAGRCAGNGAGGVPLGRARAEVAFAAMTHGKPGRTEVSSGYPPMTAVDLSNGEKRVIGMKRFVRSLGGQIRWLTAGLAVGAVLLFIASTSLPCQPRSALLLTSTLSFVAFDWVSVHTLVRIECDPVLSLIAGSQAGRIAWDIQTLSRIGLPVAIPVLLILGQAFPDAWQWVGALVAGWRGS